MNDLINVNKDAMEVLVLNYIFSNLKQSKNVSNCAGNGFMEICENDNGIKCFVIEYKVFSDYKFEDSREFFQDTVQVVLENKDEYSKKECESIKEDMYLGSANNVAFLIKLINPNVKFI